ncbi:MAG: hypothetical protein FJ313_02355 [Gemmatimonadetes bacterium]|nr:hypothetical protein [Gemmatimonadota bacterium]
MKVLERWRAASGPAASVSEARLLDALSSHEGRPWSPCRHPEGEATGATLCCSVFDLGARTWRLSKDQPCLGRFTGYDVKEIV